ncbi:large ribosomal subunit protein eL22z-like isoform X1 [Lycium barbarum]|uniref:large ribosomal subunit protein eL22z-like isoform X1 n=1 Tax=Lycium barbarum TaxID=112863 RepID=UPI00293EB7A4|nr:large ribosomal subunit protein eL22z-like isoform X1 [Lycium barbarum]XP_060178901.1 large ribosomal subunit protein eL22z-like isoform X1 [Lycium barbarum]
MSKVSTKGGKKKRATFVIHCAKPVDDKIMEIASSEKFLQERIKVGGKAGALGDTVTLTRDKTKITVTSDNTFSKRIKYSDLREYYCGLCREWSLRIAASNRLVRDFENLNASIPTRYSITMPRVGPATCEFAAQRIRKENSRMLARRCRFYI